jgi:hypothetical protein
MKLIEVYRTTNQHRDLAKAPPKCQWSKGRWYYKALLDCPLTAPRRCVIGKNGRLLASIHIHDTIYPTVEIRWIRHVKLPR